MTVMDVQIAKVRMSREYSMKLPMINEESKPKFLFLSREGEVMDFSPFLGCKDRFGLVLTPSGRGMSYVRATIKNPLDGAI